MAAARKAPARKAPAPVEAAGDPGTVDTKAIKTIAEAGADWEKDQAGYDEHLQQGFVGDRSDPTPLDAYTLAGVNAAAAEAAAEE